MKNGFKFFAALGLASVLFYSCGQKNAATTEGASSETTLTAADMKVAFVYTDSVINKYDFFEKKKEEITEKGKRFDSDLQSRARGFEQEVSMFQQTGGGMTQNQARAKQEELMQKEQNLLTYRNNLMQELSAEEAKLMNEVYDQVKAYIDEFAKEKGYHMILSQTKGGALWYATDAIDVTAAVIEGLNKKYAANPAGATVTPADSTAKK